MRYYLRCIFFVWILGQKNVDNRMSGAVLLDNLLSPFSCRRSSAVEAIFVRPEQMWLPADSRRPADCARIDWWILGQKNGDNRMSGAVLLDILLFPFSCRGGGGCTALGSLLGQYNSKALLPAILLTRQRQAMQRPILFENSGVVINSETKKLCPR